MQQSGLSMWNGSGGPFMGLRTDGPVPQPERVLDLSFPEPDKATSPN